MSGLWIGVMGIYILKFEFGWLLLCIFGIDRSRCRGDDLGINFDGRIGSDGFCEINRSWVIDVVWVFEKMCVW